MYATVELTAGLDVVEKRRWFHTVCVWQEDRYDNEPRRLLFTIHGFVDRRQAHEHIENHRAGLIARGKQILANTPGLG